jgi:hypothetical protein
LFVSVAAVFVVSVAHAQRAAAKGVLNMLLLPRHP